MSFYGPLNLDSLGSALFQGLCNAILQDEFRLMTPMVRPGADGGLDGKNEFPLRNYSELVNRPFAYTAADGSDTFWVFQCKFTQKETDKDREKVVEKELKKEIEDWKDRERKPTHYIYLTNVNLKASTLERLEKLGKEAFGFFQLWHEPKISNFVTLNVGLQKIYFPNLATSLDLARVEVVREAISLEKSVATTDKPVAQPEEAIRQLVEFEIAFLKSNKAFFDQFKIAGEPKEIPKDWTDVKYQAKQSGIFNWAQDSESINWLIQKIEAQQLTVRIWNRYIGEQTEAGDDVATLMCPPELAAELTTRLDAAFEYIPGELKAHAKVDEYLKFLEANIITALKANRLQDVKNGLRSFLHARQAYVSAKKGAPDAFYPNARRWGMRTLFGWDFMGLWDDVLRHLCDLILADKQPSDIYEFLIYLPFSLAIDAIRNELSLAAFNAEIYTLNIIFWQIVKGRPDLISSFLNKLDDLVDEIPDLNNKIESFERAAWAKDISKALAQYIGELGYLALSNKAPLKIEQLKMPLEKATNLHYGSLSFDEPFSIKEIQELQKNLRREITAIKQERYFAWATYAWHKERANGTFDSDLPLGLIMGLSIKEICEFYQRNENRDYGWHSSWFWPEGKRVVRWSAPDHDIRELLQLAILSRPVEPSDFDPLGQFEIDAIFGPFLKETQELHDTLTAKGHKLNDWAKVEAVLKSVNESRKAALLDLIQNQKELDSEKLAQLKLDFQKTLIEKSHEGSLYLVEETLLSRGWKAEFVVGAFSLERKSMFVKDSGYSHHSIHGIGGWWAEYIISGRMELFVKRAREVATVTEISKDGLQEVLAGIRDKYGDDYALLMAHGTLPWNVRQDLFVNEHELKLQGIPPRAGRRGRVGNVDVYFEKVPKDELLLVKKNSLTWVTAKRREEPHVYLVDLDSDEAKKIRAANPDTDLDLKVVARANEDGLMMFDEAAPKPIIFRFSVADTEDDDE